MTKSVFKGVCSRAVSFDIDEEGYVRNVVFNGGCDGNLNAVALLAEGRPASEVAMILEGTTCGHKKTSCPDQFAKALKAALQSAH